jgi:hypothetical protein
VMDDLSNASCVWIAHLGALSDLMPSASAPDAARARRGWAPGRGASIHAWRIDRTALQKELCSREAVPSSQKCAGCA